MVKISKFSKMNYFRYEFISVDIKLRNNSFVECLISPIGLNNELIGLGKPDWLPCHRSTYMFNS